MQATVNKPFENDFIIKNSIKYSSTGASPSRALERTGKRFFPSIMNENSDEFKNLGTFHWERRNLDYYPEVTTALRLKQT